MIKLPSQGMCLWLAQMYWELRPQTARARNLSWQFLICWAFYDMYVEACNDGN